MQLGNLKDEKVYKCVDARGGGDLTEEIFVYALILMRSMIDSYGCDH